MWRALIEASVLGEMFLALGAHDPTVIPVEVVQVGVILMGFCAGVGSTTCIVTPGSTLGRKKRGVTLCCWTKNIVLNLPAMI